MIAGVCAASHRYVDAVLADGPWGYWRAAEASGSSLVDSSGNNRPLTITGANYAREAGPRNRGVSWSSDIGTRATYASTVAWPSSTTWEAWVKIDANPAAVAPIFGSGSSNQLSTGQTELGLAVLTNGTVQMYNYNGAARFVASPSAISTGVWHHVVAFYTSTNMVLRIDKSTVATLAQGYNGQTARTFWLHGSGYNTNGGAVHIAEAAAFNKALTTAQTDVHYDAIE